MKIEDVEMKKVSNIYTQLECRYLSIYGKFECAKMCRMHMSTYPEYSIMVFRG